MLFHYFKTGWRSNVPVVLLMAACSALRVTHALLNAMILTALVARKFDWFLTIMLVDAAVVLALCLLLVLTGYLRALAVQQMSIRMRQDITTRLTAASFQEFRAHLTGTYASWLTNDMTLIEQNGFDSCFDCAQTVFDPLFSVIALLSFHWSLLVVALLVAALTVFAPQLFRRGLKSRSLTTTREAENFTATVTDQLQGYPTLFALGLEARLTAKITAAATKLMHVKLRQVKIEQWATNTGGYLNILGQIAIYAWSGLLFIHNLVPIGVVNSGGNLSFNILNSFAAFGPTLARMTALTPVLAKYGLDSTTVQAGLESATPAPVGPAALAVTGLSYDYGDHRGLAPLTVAIPAGSKVAVTGPSGAGKSTLMSILIGKLTDYHGTITIDGHPLTSLSRADLHRHLLYVDQTPYLFNGTLRENLTLGQSFSPEAIMQALKDADLTNVVANLPQGLDQPVGEGGHALSGGQKQRVAVARGLLQATGHAILLLDEPTSSLEEQEALGVEDALLSKSELTVVLITHQLHQANQARFDQIIALK
ncbi:ATP-binding cassette domain-containing protein [Lacticaseibacillus mingshuiensis]|uniref:ATP-binding cassette domain-containing protein n=1 Tax=Lacticaseibacillus mingshuiensis TaxID=2799574 RepID=UPI00194F2388|nr:ABC transporter ATP-binding protein [Lacticaseibacillus mingshuiensis]